MKTFVIIPARAGSKGVPNKNVREIHGKKLITRAVETALAAEFVDKVIVTTDGDKIATAAEEAGAMVIRQPDDISHDVVLSEYPLLFVLQSMYNHKIKVPPYFVFMQCTCPLTLPEDIDGAITHYLSTQSDTLVTVAESITTPFVWKQYDRAVAIGHCAHMRLRRQEIKNLNYIENGAFYIINTHGFLNYESRFFGKIGMYIMPTMRSLDIDSETDFALAEMMLQCQHH